MSPRVKPSGRIHKGHCQVKSCRKRGLVNTWGGVHIIEHVELSAARLQV